MHKLAPLPSMLKLIEGCKTYNDNYHEFVMSYDMEHYKKRVQMSGITGLGTVLDAGCGMGQWTAALSEFNEMVIGLDRLQHILDIAINLNNQLEACNTNFILGDLNKKLDFPDNSFDAIWSWCTLQFIDKPHVMSEFTRILKPGGYIFIGACNSIGRWVYKSLDSLRLSSFNFNRFMRCIRVIIFGKDPGSNNNYTTLKSVNELARVYNLNVVDKNLDGMIDMGGENISKPMFKPYHFGLENNIEFLLQKKI